MNLKTKKMKARIKIKSVFGEVLFEYETENNTIAKTVSEAARAYADLTSADLTSANLRYADLTSADLTSANLRYADLTSADLTSADLRYADLRYADLTSADLTSANLRYADLRYADLTSADLTSANLKYADLRYADFDKRYIQISRIGSSKRMTTYCFDDDVVMCGCFIGTLEQFEKEVSYTHKDNEQFLKEYIGFITYLKSIK